VHKLDKDLTIYEHRRNDDKQLFELMAPKGHR